MLNENKSQFYIQPQERNDRKMRIENLNENGK